MNSILGIGKYLYAVPFAIFGFFHMTNAATFNEMIGPPGGVAMIYITGICLLAASVSMLIGKFDKLAAVLLALMLILFALIIHLPNAMNGDAGQLLKDIALAGGALMYASGFARDNSVIG
ncbi:DoxX family protein [Flavilitoribacter nigricans]|uniref:DoxX family protein n=1 Tax=Flavilitoribacter nigricans (strain ATCC 23147 / DSM 23189 / NBRC 102662 / NCIMB 1420 / SS-2) TaxID=1122177 RepID=A0A2D0N6Z8_FLAN2|nr:DoxX family protein [Flavilitoribacter nigricans]PHN04274.1 DoxX family protein [Flavilitoribacter nigricans DSM 23189 = NBRC 102662]